MNRALIALGCLVVVLVAGALIAPSFIDWNKYKDPIQAEAERLTGRDVSVGGHLSFSILPSPALSADDVRIANIPGAKAEDFARLKALRVKVAFLPLLSGHIQVKQITLVEPKISLEVTADGTRNWVFANAGAEPAAQDQAGGGRGLLQAVRLDNFVIENGDITFRDEQTPASSGEATEERIQGLNAVITAQTLQGPVKASGEGVYRAVPLSFSLDAGTYSAGRPMAVSIQLKAKNAPVQGAFDGSMTDTAPHASVNGKLTINGDDLSAFIRMLNAEAKPARKIAPDFTAHKAFSLETKLSGSVDRAKLDEIALTVGDANGSGAATLSLNNGPHFEIALQVNSLDLNALLKPGQAPERNGPGPTVVDIGPNHTTPAPFVLPASANGSLDLGVAALGYRGGTVRQVRLTADLKDGKVSITRASALLPGGSDVSGTGTLMAEDGKPSFTGTVKGTSSNLRAILDWFNANPPEIPADRLTKLVLNSGVQLHGDTAAFSDLDVTLDTSRITGTGSLTFAARPNISLDVDVDRLNLDAYLGREATVPETPTQDAKPSPPAAAPAHPLAVFADFDGALKAKIDHATLMGVSADDVNLDASLKDGVATLASLVADDVAGAKIAASGSAQGFADQVKYKASVDLKSGELSDFLRSMDVSVPFARDSLGKANLTLGFDDEGAKHTLSVSGAVGKTTVMAARDMTAGEAKTFNVRFDLKNPSLSDLARQFDIGFSPISTAADTPVAINGEASGTDASSHVKLHGRVTGGSVDAAGDLASFGKNPSYKLDVSLTHDDFGNLVRLLGADYARKPGTVGAIKAKAQVEGDGKHADLTGLQVTIGEASATGTVSVDTSGKLPRITANLQAGDIALDPFLRPVSAGVEQAKQAGQIDPGARRWSRSRMALDWLTKYGADVELKADRLSARGYDFLDPDIKLLLDNGTMTVRQFTGRLFGGALDLRAVLRGQGTPDLSVTFSLSNASVEGALASMAGVSAASGSFSANGSVSASGNNQMEMISDLTGSATVKAQNGVLRGIDLAQIAPGAAKIKAMDDITKLLRNATTQGTTPYKSIQATLRFDNGMMTAQNVSADIDAAKGTINAVVDLPQWMTSIDSQFQIKGLPGSPPVGIELNGAVSSPRRTVQTADLKQFLARNVDQTMLQGVIEQDNKGLNELLGSDKPPSSPPPAPKAPEQPKASQ